MKKFIIASLLMVSGIAFAQSNNSSDTSTPKATQGTTTTHTTVSQTQDPTTGEKRTHKVKRKTKVQDSTEAKDGTSGDSTQAD